MRASNLATYRTLLEELREGKVTFAAIVRATRPALEQRAERFLRLWQWSGQTSVGVEDLVQEMTIALWRAVDSWDAEKADLVRYVDAQLGRACQRKLRWTAGYPDSRRRAPAKQVFVEDLTKVTDLLTGEVFYYPAEHALHARRRASSLLADLVGLERHVVELVLDGSTIDDATRKIYGDVDKRLAYQMDSLRDARRLVSAAIRRATYVAEEDEAT